VFLAGISGVRQVARRSPKLPLASGGGSDPAITISDTDWQRIETAYGASLPGDVRAEIFRAIEAFLFLDSFERRAELSAKGKVILEAHDRAATRFFNELFVGASAASDEGVYAHYLIENNFKASQLGTEGAGLDAFLNLLRAFHVACNTSIKQVNEASAFREGNAWTNWIDWLTEILEEAKLPCLVRKDVGSKSKSDKQSPLVLLVWELQNCLPEGCRRHTQSEAALADAISGVQSLVRKLRGNK
jgi:hypothetical protein